MLVDRLVHEALEIALIVPHFEGKREYGSSQPCAIRIVTCSAEKLERLPRWLADDQAVMIELRGDRRR